MTASTVELNPGVGGAKPAVDSLATLDGAAAPASAVAQLIKLIFGDAGDGRMVSETYGLPTAPVPPAFLRVGFSEVGSGLVGGAADALTLVRTGGGMTVSQSAGNLVIATGTTANSETVIRSNQAFRGAMLARMKLTLSQRIINQVFRFEVADLVGSGLSYTINSATSITVTFPTTNPFAATNVGQSVRLSNITGAAGIPGRFAIASVSGLTVNFTVAAWPASGSGTLDLYGHNFFALEYSGTGATSAFFDAQRRGWASGNTTVTTATTASGHVPQVVYDVNTATLSDAVSTSGAVYQWTQRASRIENLPDPDVDLYLFLVVQNGSTAPSSNTNMTVGFLQVEDNGRQKVRIASADSAGASFAMPVQVMGGGLATQAVSGSLTSAGTTTNTPVTPTQSFVNSAATTNATSTKATAGTVWSIVASNINAATRYLKLYNKASAPTVGTDVPVLVIPIPPGAVVTVDGGSNGIRFGTGIAWALTAGAADSDTAAVAASEHKVAIAYT